MGPQSVHSVGARVQAHGRGFSREQAAACPVVVARGTAAVGPRARVGAVGVLCQLLLRRRELRLQLLDLHRARVFL